MTLSFSSGSIFETRPFIYPLQAFGHSIEGNVLQRRVKCIYMQPRDVYIY